MALLQPTAGMHPAIGSAWLRTSCPCGFIGAGFPPPPGTANQQARTGQTARRAMRHARPDSRQASTLAKLVSCRVWPAKISRPALRSPGNHTYSQRDGPAFNYCGGLKSIRITSKRRSPQIESQLVKTIRSIIRAKKGFSKSPVDSDRNYIL